MVERSPLLPHKPHRDPDVFQFFFFSKKILLIFFIIFMLTTIIIVSHKNSMKNKFFEKEEMIIQITNKEKIIEYASLFFLKKKNMFLTFSYLCNISSISERFHTPLAHIVSKDLFVIEGGNGSSYKKKNFVKFDDNIDIFHSAGYHFQTDSAQFDIKTGETLSKSPVVGYSPFGAMTSDGLCIRDEGRAVILMGRSRILLDPNHSREIY